MTHIIYKRPDGGISVCMPCISSDDENGFTLKKAINRSLKNDIPKGATKVTVVTRPVTDINHPFFDAAVDINEDNSLSFDMVKAKKIAKDKVLDHMKRSQKDMAHLRVIYPEDHPKIITHNKLMESYKTNYKKIDNLNVSGVDNLDYLQILNDSMEVISIEDL